LFDEIPVARPWDADSERLAYEHTIEQAVYAGDLEKVDDAGLLDHLTIELIGTEVIPKFR
jgi:hypothetical protein